MRERRDIVDLWKRGGARALATLVGVEGSSYRRPGARLLITADGEYAGAISGGCLEAEVIRKAQWMVREGARVERYSTLFDDTADIPYGLGCGGVVDVLLERADTPEFEALMQAFEATLRGESRRVLTQLPEAGARFRRCVLGADEGIVFRSATGPVDAAQPLFDELLLPPRRLLLFGAGDDARPLVRVAAMLGWRTVVIDSRAQWARAERFPEAETIATSLENVAVQPDDAVVLMTHSYEQDREWLTAMLPARPRYLGLLGARHRSALLLRDAADVLGWTLEQACAGLFAPVGLDLGGDGAEAIALAVIAEIQAYVQGKLGRSRRITPELIEEQCASGGAARYSQGAVRAVRSPRTAGVVLAAGLSTRLGRPKQIEMLGGETLVERTVRVAMEAGLAPVFAVILDEALIPRLQARGALPLLNRRAYEGLASSIRVGVDAALPLAIEGLVLMTCDQVGLTAEHVRALCVEPEEPAGSAYAGRTGIPAYFPRASFGALLELEGDKGARDLLRVVRAVECEDLALDVDTEADLGRAREYVERVRS
jgi:xanthine dehydrogenase accessory factor